MQGQFINIGNSDLEKLIPSNHFLKRINQFVNFRFCSVLTEHLYSQNRGRVGISPELYLRIKLIGHLYNIHSNRQLIEHVHYNISYRWFCGLKLTDPVPHHSSLSRIKKRLGVNVLEEFFKNIVQQCKHFGLLNSTSVMTDSLT